MRRGIVTIAVGLLLTVAGTALAAWSAIASGTATASSTTVDTAVVNASVSGATVTITWPDVSVGDAKAGSYTVTRYPAAGGAGAELGCTASPCTDAPGSGTWQYGVVAHYNNWSGSEARSGNAVVTTTTTTAPAFALSLLVDTVTAFTAGNQTARLRNVPAGSSVTFTIDSTTLAATGPTGSDYGLTIPCMTNGTKTVTATARNGATVVGTATDTFSLNGLCALSINLVDGDSNAGKVGPGDSIRVAFSAAVSLSSICPSGWTGSSRPVTASISNAVASDGVDIDLPTCDSGTNKFAFGTLSLGSTSYVDKAVTTTGSTIAWDATSNTLVITLGTPCTAGGSCGTRSAVASSTATYTPANAIKSTANVAASGSASKTGRHF